MQISMFDGEKPYKINKPIRLIELFAGIEVGQAVTVIAEEGKIVIVKNAKQTYSAACEAKKMIKSRTED